ncbi:MAG: capsule biosynthesis protein [Rhodobacteraceae bacterium]|nr:capsule biosynthesis protein [Paracoccaceae bacterium]TVR48001.1 MAG: capsule biosynthesis protein [Paracoccaceae bacterium]
MTTPIKSKRFRLRRSGTGSGTEDTGKDNAPAPPVEDADYELVDEGSADTDAPRRDPNQDTRAALVVRKSGKTGNTQPDPEEAARAATGIDAIRAEGLTARQLRMAMRVAQKHGVRATSAYEAVLILRQRGIDPFARSTMLELVNSDSGPGREIAKRNETAPAKTDDGASPPAQSDRMARIAAEREKELKRVRRDIAKRRRKRLILLGARLLVFVTLPTFLVTWYFYVIATPMYGTESQFIIQQADSQNGMGAMAGMLPSAAGMGLGGQSEAASVQAYLQSRAAMLRLDQEEGFRDHFQQDHIDLLRRLAPDASAQQAYRTYQRHVQIGYDPTEGVVRMEVIAASAEDSERFAQALIRFAEEHVDMMTQRLRDSQLGEARASLEEAQQNLNEARQAAVDLQERSAVMSGEVELSLISQQIGTLEAELTQTRLSLEELQSNPRPNPARVQPLERREQALRREIESLRGSMTRGPEDGSSLARIQSELIMAEAEVQTREMMRAQAMQQLESARIEVSRQVRYLALSVAPVAPDEATYPRKLENSAVAFLIFLGIYLFMSMTASVLREQISG